MRHQAGNEMHVAREPVELGDDDGTLELASGRERSLERGPALKCVGTLAGLLLRERVGNRKAFRLGKPVERCPLGVEAKALPSWKPNLIGSPPLLKTI